MWAPSPHTPELEPHTTAMCHILRDIYAFSRRVVRCPPLDGHMVLRCKRVWDDAYVMIIKQGNRCALVVIRLVDGEPEVVAKFNVNRVTPEKIARVMRYLANVLGVCDDFEAYDACMLEEVGRATEETLALLGDP